MTTYAYIENNVILTAPVTVPSVARRLDNQQWVMGLPSAPATLQEACGYYVVTAVAPPTPGAGQAVDLTYTMQAGRPTETWTLRAVTPEESRSLNFSALVDLTTITTKMGDLESFFSDPDVVATSNQTNNQAASAQQLNRYNKAVITELRRIKNMQVRIIRALLGRYDPSLLDTISDV